MLCINCRTNNEPGAVFCRYCGRPLSQAPSKDHRPPSGQFQSPSGQPQPPSGQFQPPSGQFQPPSGQPQPPTVPPPYKPPNSGGNKKTVLIACLSAGGALLLALASVIIVLLIMNNKPPKPVIDSTIAVVASTAVGETEPASTAPAYNPYPNVIDECSALTDSQRAELQAMIERKMNSCGKDIILYVTDASEGDLADFANAKCSDKCGSNAILPAIDSGLRKSAYSVLGNASKLMSKTVISSAVSNADKLLGSGDLFGASKKLIELIPDSEEQAKAYSFKPVSGSSQVVYVQSNSSHTSGKLTVVNWADDTPTIAYEIDTVYLGMDGITENPREGLSATPKGTFKLGFAFSDHSLNTKLNTRIITNGDVWVDDPDSAYYNTLQHGSTSNSYWSSAEDTYSTFSSGRNEACILIEHNGDGYTCGARNKGSCMYVTGKNTDLTTSWGDVNMTADQMYTLLSYLDASKNPYIVIS